MRRLHSDRAYICFFSGTTELLVVEANGYSGEKNECWNHWCVHSFGIFRIRWFAPNNSTFAHHYTLHSIVTIVRTCLVKNLKNYTVILALDFRSFNHVRHIRSAAEVITCSRMNFHAATAKQIVRCHQPERWFEQTHKCIHGSTREAHCNSIIYTDSRIAEPKWKLFCSA